LIGYSIEYRHLTFQSVIYNPLDIKWLEQNKLLVNQLVERLLEKHWQPKLSGDKLQLLVELKNRIDISKRLQHQMMN
jgi:hypothetical protein